MLLHSYMMVGDTEKANSFAQISMYHHLIALIGDAVNYLNMHMQDKEICAETIRRIDQLIEAFKLDALDLNVIAIYQYQVAVYYAFTAGLFELIGRYAVAKVMAIMNIRKKWSANRS
ncbi:MAG: hypothetical protein UHN47_08970 [Lachnospiraceae bacterium]|nr:hypothetical protein [Lachnospiraceae bacterium]